MSELREWTASEIEEYDDARLELAEDGKIDCTRVYIKDDADEVISTIKAERDEYRYNLSCARNEIHNLSLSMKEDVKTIAEKDKEIAELKADYDEVRGRLQTANLIKEEQLAATRLQKYKRCLAMARWCFTKANYHFYLARSGEDSKENLRKDAIYTKWSKRWLKIAEQFKETK